MKQHLGYLALLGLLGCSPSPPTAIIVHLSSEPKIPTEISSMEVRISRGGKEKFARTYNLRAGERLPGTLTLSKDDDGSGPISIKVSASQGDGKPWRVVREARFSFVDGKSKLLRLPLRYSCLDKLQTCADGLTCVGGVCRSAEVDGEKLPDFRSNDKEVVSIPASTTETTPVEDCFYTEGCFSAAVDVPFSPKDCSLRAPGPEGSFNVAMRWKDLPGNLTVLDLDPYEGFELDQGRIVLAEGLCEAMKDGSATAIVVSSQCPTKDYDLPVCELEGEVPIADDCIPEPETCNGLDDDCDGIVDNDLVDEAIDCAADGVGRCSAGLTFCQDSTPQCEPLLPAEEECNGFDDNCDGQVDEGCFCAPGEVFSCYTGPDYAADVGRCLSGTQSCDENGEIGPCEGSVEPVEETCNGEDDNCDGQVDEGCEDPGAGGAAGDGQGGDAGDGGDPGTGGDAGDGGDSGTGGDAGDGGEAGDGGDAGTGGEAGTGGGSPYDCEAPIDCTGCSKLSAICADASCEQMDQCVNATFCEEDCNAGANATHVCLANSAVTDCTSFVECLQTCP